MSLCQIFMVLVNKRKHPTFTHERWLFWNPFVHMSTFLIFYPRLLLSQQLGTQSSCGCVEGALVWCVLTSAGSTHRSVETDTLNFWPKGLLDGPAEMLIWVERWGMQPRQVALFVLHMRGQSIAGSCVKTDHGERTEEQKEDSTPVFMRLQKFMAWADKTKVI